MDGLDPPIHVSACLSLTSGNVDGRVERGHDVLRGPASAYGKYPSGRAWVSLISSMTKLAETSVMSTFAIRRW